MRKDHVSRELCPRFPALAATLRPSATGEGVPRSGQTWMKVARSAGYSADLHHQSSDSHSVLRPSAGGQALLARTHPDPPQAYGAHVTERGEGRNAKLRGELQELAVIAYEGC